MIRSKVLFFTLLLVSGGTLLGYELLSVKIIEPYLGGSIYVWASNIGTTMFGLALGYFLAPFLISKWTARKTVFGVYILLAVLYLSQIFLTPAILNTILDMDVVSSSVVATVYVNVPIFLLFGLLTPMYIEVFPDKDTGHKAGSLYATSTLGGVIFLMFTGLYFLPHFGLNLSIITSAVLCVILAFGTYFHSYFYEYN